jgi:trigger factor
MDVSVAEAGPCRRTLTIKVPPERIRSHLAELYRSASSRVRMKGFRQGHVPRKVIEKMYGESILAEAKESLVNRTFQEACQTHNLTVVGQPKLEGLDETPLTDEKELEYSVTLDVRPEFDLGDVTGIEVESKSTEVTDEDVQSALQQLADQKKTLDVIAEDVSAGDFVRSDLTFRDENGAVVHEKKGVQLSTNIPIAGTDAGEFTSRLVGTAKGQDVSLDLTFPPTFEKTDVRGKRGSVTITILDVLRVQSAPIDDELAKGFDYDSLAALTDELRKRIAAEKERAEKQRQEDTILEVLANAHPFELPASLVDGQAEQSLASYRARMEQAKVPAEEIDQKVDAARTEARQHAERRVRLFFILDQIARQEKIFVNESDVDVELRNIAAQNNATLEDVIEHFEKNNLTNELRVGIMERKVREFLREKAKISR